MALKKSQLYASLWQSCDELRGGMDASQYKDYVLTLLFMKYVSDKCTGKPGAIILPHGTGIPACILVLDKERAASRADIFMIDASRGLFKDGSKKRLRAQDIHRIVDVFTRRKEVPRFSRMVPLYPA